MHTRKVFLTGTVWARGLILLGWMAVIFAFSALPGSPYAPANPTLWYFLERKGAHVIEYLILMALAVRFFYALLPKERFRNILIGAVLLSLLYAATDELHQSFVPYRGAKITDILIDAGGIAITALLLWAARPPKKLRKSKRKKTKKT